MQRYSVFITFAPLSDKNIAKITFKSSINKKVMAYNPDKELKLYYSISEVAEMFGVTETLLRYWEKEFKNIRPKKANRNIRQYTKEDIEEVRSVYHLVKEKGMTLEGARRVLKASKDGTSKVSEVSDRLKQIREDLAAIKKELDSIV